jgi:fibronectin type 3 domain-containing protein
VAADALERGARCLALAALAALGCSGVPVTLQEALVPEPPLVFEAGADLLAPEHLSVRSNTDRTIVLSWSPVLVGDVAGYVVTRALSARGPYAPIGRTRSRFATIFVDSGPTPGSLGDGQTYHYRVHAHDRTGRVADRHAALTARTEDKPDPPAGLTIYSSLPRKVVLSWDPAARGSVSGYAIYRSPTAAGPYERVALIPGRLQTLYEDRVEGDLRVMYYRITALNQFSGESEQTPPQRAVTKAEPLPPIGVSVGERRIGAIELRWEPNVERDLLAYEVWRAAGGPQGWSAETRIGEVPPGDAGPPRYTDPAVGCGQPVRYRVRALDRDGLSSDYSAGLEVRGLDLGLSVATDAQGRRELRWDPAYVSEWPRTRIDLERGMGLPPRTLGHAQGESRFTLPGDLDPGATLRVVLERSDPAGSGLRESPPCQVSLAPAPGERNARR